MRSHTVISFISAFSVTLHRIFLYMLTALALAASSQLANAQIVVPLDANTTPPCALSQAEFNSWFGSGSVTLNGIVEPANGLIFSPNSNCSFYKWSEQMFLWLTSPAPSKYGKGAHVFDSPVFYQVSPPDSLGQRTLIPNSPGVVPILGPDIPQLGRQRKPVVVDSAGNVHNVIRAEVGPSGRPIVRNKAGQSIEIGRLQVGPGGKPIVLDTTGRAIDTQVRNGNPLLRDGEGNVIELRGRILVSGIPMFLDQAGNAVATEEGQAQGGGVLMTLGGSLTYYLLQVNDVFAYLLTGVKNFAISASTFPTTSVDLSNVNGYAQLHSKFIPDLPAMAVEVKSSWIETTGLANVGDYLTITATIPTYTPDSSTPQTLWHATGTKQAQLAMVGMHVVGTVAGQPEMLWATFEHVNNAPDAQYTYTTTGIGNPTQLIPQNTVGNFLFTASGTSSNFNDWRMSVSGTDIKAKTTKTIGPSNPLRINPWGTASSNSSFTANNTDVISLNHSVITKLAPGDVRAHYVHKGTTWTAGGQNPFTGAQVGTNAMANTTMETFHQGTNCFTCHSDPTMLGGSSGNSGLSHIWEPLQKLF